MSVSAGPEILIEQKFEHPEGIVWDARHRRLLWLDVFKGLVLSYDLSSGALETSEVGRVVGAVAPRARGGLVCAVREGFGFLSEDGTFSLVSDHLRDSPQLQMNDGAVDPSGRFWAGSMSFEYETRPGTGALYRLDPNGAVSERLGGVSVSNGIGWSPDGRRCYYVDSATRRIDAFQFDAETGTLGRRETLAEVEAMPDGLAVDVDGCVWVAMFQGSEVHRFTPAGSVDRIIRLPGTQVTTCSFGGEDLDVLFIAVSPFGLDEATLREQRAGYIYAFDPGVTGVDCPEFLG
jgi:sugar lactone lactonase YvrE